MFFAPLGVFKVFPSWLQNYPQRPLFVLFLANGILDLPKSCLIFACIIGCFRATSDGVLAVQGCFRGGALSASTLRVCLVQGILKLSKSWQVPSLTDPGLKGCLHGLLQRQDFWLNSGFTVF